MWSFVNTQTVHTHTHSTHTQYTHTHTRFPWPRGLFHTPLRFTALIATWSSGWCRQRLRWREWDAMILLAALWLWWSWNPASALVHEIADCTSFSSAPFASHKFRFGITQEVPFTLQKFRLHYTSSVYVSFALQMFRFCITQVPFG